VEHVGVLNMLVAVQKLAQIEASDSGLHFYGLGFDGSVVNVMIMLLAGARLITRGVRSDWIPLLKGTNIGFFTPSVVALLDPSLSFKLILVGGEALPIALLKCKWRLLNIYGPTETTVISSARLLSASDHVVSAGKPLPGLKYSIVDARMRLLPIGCVGELLIHGVGVARGYLNNPKKTEAVFKRNVIYEGKVYCSGDSARWLSDGSVEVLGRKDSQVKVNGFRIELGEVEAVMLKTCKVWERRKKERTRAHFLFGRRPFA
jgi:non-ribosomal peptide synthetase component F